MGEKFEGIKGERKIEFEDFQYKDIKGPEYQYIDTSGMGKIDKPIILNNCMLLKEPSIESKTGKGTIKYKKYGCNSNNFKDDEDEDTRLKDKFKE